MCVCLCEYVCLSVYVVLCVFVRTGSVVVVYVFAQQSYVDHPDHLMGDTHIFVTLLKHMYCTCEACVPISVCARVCVGGIS